MELLDPEEGGARHRYRHCEEIDDRDTGTDHDRATEAECDTPPFTQTFLLLRLIANVLLVDRQRSAKTGPTCAKQTSNMPAKRVESAGIMLRLVNNQALSVDSPMTRKKQSFGALSSRKQAKGMMIDARETSCAGMRNVNCQC